VDPTERSVAMFFEGSTWIGYPKPPKLFPAATGSVDYVWGTEQGLNLHLRASAMLPITLSARRELLHHTLASSLVLI
jgi:hypothetical protein